MQPIALTDVIESAGGHLSHVDCSRPSTLTPAERQLVFLYCSDHVVAECIACNATYRFSELGADAMRGRSNQCTGCRQDLSDSIRSHLYACAMLPSEVRRRAREVREAAQRLAKESQQLRAAADLTRRQLEAELFESQERLHAAMGKRPSR